ncbi:MAG: zinc ribbon domain-containing protein [Desulfobacteraceae bacterium]|nr:zinc ribbon domain-containing protein [Desulfobacteraceae bacterium]
MPIFEYKCQDCGHCFEKLVFAGDKVAEMACPKCGEKKVDRLMSCANALGGAKSGLCAPGSSRFT